MSSAVTLRWTLGLPFPFIDEEDHPVCVRALIGLSISFVLFFEILKRRLDELQFC